MAKKIELTVNIKGRAWIIRLLAKSVYTKNFGTDSSAITLLDKKEICVSKLDYLIGHIRHELMHAFVVESNTESAFLNAAQMEELCCSIVGDYAIEIVALADRIQTYFQIHS